MNLIEITRADEMHNFSNERAIEVARQIQLAEDEAERKAKERLPYQIKAIQDKIKEEANWGLKGADYEIYPKKNPTVWEGYERNISIIREAFETAGYQIWYTARRPGYKYYESGQTGYFTISWR